MPSLIEHNAVVLFQGDSTTAAGRDAGNPADLGQGYAMIAAAWFSALYPERRVSFLNRGIGGNRTVDLKNRWQSDCIELKPTWVSIMIGINDVWWRYEGAEGTSAEHYESLYRDILRPVRDELGAELVLCEPFVLPSAPDREQWREDLDPKIQVVRKLAREFGALLVPLDGVFAEACTHREPEFWAADGVHPSPPAHALIARTWLQAVGAI
ncbi:MAG: SGNH/GDSL hydrolase family protein [Planctomycetota bacterium]|jgi:lysophospholipase L1-like esterase